MRSWGIVVVLCRAGGPIGLGLFKNVQGLFSIPHNSAFLFIPNELAHLQKISPAACCDFFCVYPYLVRPSLLLFLSDDLEHSADGPYCDACFAVLAQLKDCIGLSCVGLTIAEDGKALPNDGRPNGRLKNLKHLLLRKGVGEDSVEGMMSENLIFLFCVCYIGSMLDDNKRFLVVFVWFAA